MTNSSHRIARCLLLLPLAILFAFAGGRGDAQSIDLSAAAPASRTLPLAAEPGLAVAEQAETRTFAGQPAVEVLDARDERRRVFRDAAGRMHAVIGYQPRHMRNRDGRWVPIDTRVKSIGGGDWSLGVRQAPYRSYLRRLEAGKPVMRFVAECEGDQQKHALDVIPAGIVWRNTKTGETRTMHAGPVARNAATSGSVVRYDGAYGNGINLVVGHGPTSIHKDIEFESASALSGRDSLPGDAADWVLEWQAVIEGMDAMDVRFHDGRTLGAGTMVADCGANVFGVDCGDQLFTIDDPLACDANGEETPVALSWSRRADGRVVVGKRIPVSFLDSAAWPVRADAVFIVGPTTSGRANKSNTNYTTARNAASGGNNAVIRVGQRFNSGNSRYYLWRGLLRFDISGIPDNATIMAAALHLEQLSNSTATDFDLSITDWTEAADGRSGADYNGYTSLNSPLVYGTFNTTGLPGNGNVFVVDVSSAINAPGPGGISATGSFADFMLRSSRDISATVPTGNERFDIEATGVELHVTWNVPIGAPTNLMAVGHTTTSIDWEWTDNASTEDGFSLQDDASVEVATFGASPGAGNQASSTETGLTENTLVSRHVHAVEGGQESDPSNTDSTYTSVHEPTDCDFQVSANGATVTVTVMPPPNETAGLTAVHIQRSSDGSVWSDVKDFATAGYTAEDTAAVVGVNWYRIRYRNGDGDVTGWSPVLQRNTGPAAGVPTDVTAVAVAGNVEVEWTGFLADTHHVYRGTDPNGPFDRIASTPAATGSWTDTTAVAGTVYWYTVTSYTGPVESQFAIPASVEAGAPALVAVVPEGGSSDTSMSVVVMAERSNFIDQPGTIASISPGPGLDVSTISVVGLPGWTPGELVGHWVMFPQYSNRAHRIILSSETTFAVVVDLEFPGIQPGDSYQLVAKPSFTLAGESLVVDDLYSVAPTVLMLSVTLENESNGAPAADGDWDVTTTTAFDVGGTPETLSLPASFHVEAPVGGAPTVSITPAGGTNITADFSVGVSYSGDVDPSRTTFVMWEAEYDDGNTVYPPGTNLAGVFGFDTGAMVTIATRAFVQKPGTNDPYTGRITFSATVVDHDGNRSEPATSLCWMDADNPGDITFVSPDSARVGDQNQAFTIGIDLGPVVVPVTFSSDDPAITESAAAVYDPVAQEVTLELDFGANTRVGEHQLTLINNAIPRDFGLLVHPPVGTGPNAPVVEDNPAQLLDMPRNNTTGGYGVDLPSGRLRIAEVDLALPGGFAFTRVYRSTSNRSGLLGNNWISNFETYFEVDTGANAIHYVVGGRKYTATYLDLSGVQYDGYYIEDLYSRIDAYTDPLLATPRVGTPQAGDYLVLVGPHGNRVVSTQLVSGLFGGGPCGRIDKVVDRNDNTVQCVYNRVGQLVMVIDAYERIVRFEYYDNGLLHRVCDWTTGSDWYWTGSQGRWITYIYDANRNLIEVQAPETARYNGANVISSKYVYDEVAYLNGEAADSLITTFRDGKDQEWCHVNWGQPVAGQVMVTSQVIGTGTITFNYSFGGPFGDTVFEVNRVGHKRELLFTAGTGELILSRQYSKQWSPDGLTEIGGKVRDGSGDGPADPDSWTTSFEWGAHHEITAVILPMGNRTDYGFEESIGDHPDPRRDGDLKEIVRVPDFARGGRQPEHVWFWEFDDNGLVTEYWSPRSSDEDETVSTLVTITRDARGNAIQVDSPFVTLAKEIGGYVATTRSLYDERGRVVSTTDPEGKVTIFSYTDDGFLASVTDDWGGTNRTTSYTYNAVGYVLSATDARGFTSSFTPNELGQTIRTVDPQGYWAINAFSKNGVLTDSIRSKHDSYGNGPAVPTLGSIDSPELFAGGADVMTTAWDHDILNNVISVDETISPGRVRQFQYQYDAADRLTVITRPEGPNNTTHYTWDERNMMFAVERSKFATVAESNGVSPATRAESDVDLNGNVIRTRVYNDVADSLNEQTWMQHAADPTMTGELYALTTYNYDGYDRVLQVFNGAQEGVFYDYNAEFAKATWTTDSTGAVLTGTWYDHDERGMVRQVRTLATTSEQRETSPLTVFGNDLDSVLAQINPAFTFDSDNNGVAVTDIYREDKRGLVTRTINDLGQERSTVYRADGMVQSASAPSVNGRIDRVHYEYNRTLQLASATREFFNTETGAVVLHKMAYKYDALGRRVQVVDNTGSTWKFAYGNDRSSHSIDPTGAEHRVDTNQIGWPIAIHDIGAAADGTDITHTYGYDDLGRVLTIDDDENNTTTNGYNVRGDRVQIIDADGNITEQRFNDRGQLIYRQGPEGETSTYTYHPLHQRLTSVTGTAANQAQYDGFYQEFRTDPFGIREARNKQIVNGTSFAVARNLFDYDSYGRADATTEEHGFERYNNSGVSLNSRLYKASYNSLVQTAREWSDATVQTFTHDGMNRVTSMTDPVTDNVGFGNPWAYEYEGYQVTRTRFSGFRHYENERTYDGDRRLASQITRGVFGQNPNIEIAGTRYAYTERNELQAVSFSELGGLGEYFVYDKRGRRIDEFHGVVNPHQLSAAPTDPADFQMRITTTIDDADHVTNTETFGDDGNLAYDSKVDYDVPGGGGSHALGLPSVINENVGVLTAHEFSWDKSHRLIWESRVQPVAAPVQHPGFTYRYDLAGGIADVMKDSGATPKVADATDLVLKQYMRDSFGRIVLDMNGAGGAGEGGADAVHALASNYGIGSGMAIEKWELEPVGPNLAVVSGPYKQTPGGATTNPVGGQKTYFDGNVRIDATTGLVIERVYHSIEKHEDIRVSGTFGSGVIATYDPATDTTVIEMTMYDDPALWPGRVIRILNPGLTGGQEMGAGVIVSAVPGSGQYTAIVTVKGNLTAYAVEGARWEVSDEFTYEVATVTVHDGFTGVTDDTVTQVSVVGGQLFDPNSTPDLPTVIADGLLRGCARVEDSTAGGQQSFSIEWGGSGSFYFRGDVSAQFAIGSNFTFLSTCTSQRNDCVPTVLVGTQPEEIPPVFQDGEIEIPEPRICGTAGFNGDDIVDAIADQLAQNFEAASGPRVVQPTGTGNAGGDGAVVGGRPYIEWLLKDWSCDYWVQGEDDLWYPATWDDQRKGPVADPNVNEGLTRKELDELYKPSFWDNLDDIDNSPLGWFLPLDSLKLIKNIVHGFNTGDWSGLGDQAWEAALELVVGAALAGIVTKLIKRWRKGRKVAHDQPQVAEMDNPPARDPNRKTGEPLREHERGLGDTPEASQARLNQAQRRVLNHPAYDAMREFGDEYRIPRGESPEDQLQLLADLTAEDGVEYAVVRRPNGELVIRRGNDTTVRHDGGEQLLVHSHPRSTVASDWDYDAWDAMGLDEAWIAYADGTARRYHKGSDGEWLFGELRDFR